jgi:type III pantothenate kinase
MFLAVDIGNTSAHFGLFKQNEPFEMTFRFPTASIIAMENIESELIPKLSALGDLSSITLASVVPKATAALQKILAGSHPEAKITVLTNNDIPLRNNYTNPDETGIDRLLASYSAFIQWGKPLKKPMIVIDLGTATTFDCINIDGEFLGGIIALGIRSSADSLSKLGAQLPEIFLEFSDHILGQSTLESMQSGIMHGAIAMIEGLVMKLRNQVFPNDDVIVVATGGLSNILEGKTSAINYFSSNLVLEGISKLSHIVQ